MLLNGDYITVGYANDRASNTGIVGFLEVGNRSIILTEYKDAPQWRSSLKHWNCLVLGASTQPTGRKSD